MRALCERIRDDGAFALVAEQCAVALSHAQRTTGLEALAAELRRSGHAVGRTFGVSANARLLRSGMRQSTWSLLADLDQHRMVLQARLGVVVDLRVFCRIAVVNPQYGTRLRTELMRMRGAPVRGGEDAQILSGMLWPQPVELRATRRPAWHPYRAVGPTEPGLMRALLVDSGSVTLDVADAHWRDQMAQALNRHGIARLSARDVDRATLGDAITWFASTPIDVGWLHLHAAVERIEASEGRVTAVFELRELG